MPFLRINGWTVPVINASPKQAIARVGRRERSFRGQLRDSRRFERRTWDVTTIVRDHHDAFSLDHLISGRAHFFDLLDGLQADTALMPLPPGALAGSVLVPGADGAYGFGRLTVPQASTETVLAYDAQLGSEWTAVFFREDSGGDWVGHGVRSDGSAYVDGVESLTFNFPSSAGGDGLFVRVTDGIVEIVKDATAQEENIDDIAILSYRASDALLAALTQDPSTGLKFGPAPFVRVDGDLFGEETVCYGQVLDSTILQKPATVPGIGWVNNARTVRFSLTEIDPRFFAV